MEGMNNILICTAGGYAGAIAVGAILTGAPIMDLATSVSGAAGAAIGFAAGKVLESQMPSDYAMAFPVAGAILVPGLAGGVWDVQLLAIAGGAVVGGRLTAMWQDK